MRCGGKRGRVAYFLYRAASRGLSPFLFFHLQWRKLRGLEHPLRWPERLGHPSSPRPPGPLLWFHAVSLGEGMATIPVIKHCNQQQPNFTILMTTTTTSAFEVVKDRLPNGIIYQFAPIDTPAAVDAFLGYWKPNAVFLMESELWPNLIVSASEKGEYLECPLPWEGHFQVVSLKFSILVALLNARISAKSFKFWSGPTALPLISLMLSKFSLIAPLSTLEAIRFQLLQAPPFIINFAGDLKYAVGDVDVSEKENSKIEDLQLQLAHRPVWMAASIHKGEDEVMILVHKALIRIYPSVVTIIVPRDPQHGRQISLALQREGLHVVLRSQTEKILPSTNFYVVDTLGELRSLYRLTPIAVLGGSFLPGLAGHNISEAAAAGCAVLTGPYVGHFSHMVLEMQQLNRLSVMQVSSKELMGALKMLLGNAEALEAHRLAAKQAFLALSSGVVRNVWNLVDAHVLKGLLGN